MKKYQYLFLALFAGLFCCVVEPADAQKWDETTSASGVIHVREKAGPRYQQGGARRVQLIQVMPLRGNNPFNTRDPINNTTINGQVVYRAVDEPGQTGAPPGGIRGCIGSINFAESPLAPPGIYFAGIDLNPNTGVCTLRNDGQGQTLILQTPPSGPVVPAGEIEAFPDRVVGVWEFTPPSPPGGPGVSVKFFPGTQQTFWLIATTGLKVRIVLNVTQLGPNSFRMNVTEISEVP